ncbi:aspartyl protease family protein [Carboxylicivirga marina]|uniref:Aspartyl protease family protein n=1 Tax=Carboxylicivirga marina TaxID=2800988 RepID=A0ABS1HK44_9BACT|nr:aspartyl protease family protein [Carboxylicivirga marina]MBK3518042.1 aspartyl protease family protein [Carboxylicivirga marina]
MNHLLRIFSTRMILPQLRVSSLLLCLMFSLGAHAQFNSGRILNDDFYAEIPFEYEHDKIVINATMNGVEGRYLLDTGAMCILFKDSVKHDFINLNEMNVGDASGKKQQSQVVQMPSIKVGQLQYENIPTLYVDMFTGPFKCLGYKGIIGSNLLRFGAFKIDWEAQKLIIADSYKAFGADKSNSSKMFINKQQSSPFVKMKVNGKNIKWVLVDTGSGDSFAMYNETAAWLRQKEVIASPLYESSGTNSHGAWGAGSYQMTIYNDLKLELGKSTIFKHSIVETSSGKSKIGMKLLNQKDFVIDYPNKRFFFDVGEVNETIEFKSFGLDIIMEGDSFVVNGVWKGTDAESFGVVKGDLIEDIEGVGFKQKSTCEVFLGLKELTQNRDELTFHFINEKTQSRKIVTLSRIKF